MSQDNVIDRLPRDFGKVGEELHLLAMRGNLLSSLEMVPEEAGALRKLRILNVEFNNLKVCVHFRSVNQLRSSLQW